MDKDWNVRAWKKLIGHHTAQTQKFRRPANDAASRIAKRQAVAKKKPLNADDCQRCHHENNRHLASHVRLQGVDDAARQGRRMISSERQKSKIPRIQHKLDAHKNDDRITFDYHAERAYREHNDAQSQISRKRNRFH